MPGLPTAPFAEHTGWMDGMADRFPEITSVEEFVRLRESTDPAEYERSAWAAMPLPVWWSLLRERPDMNFWAAHNRTAPPEILAALIEDPDWRVRVRVAGRRDCPPALLDRLAGDPHDSVRRSVAGHPNSPRSALARLLDDEWPVIAQEARARLSERP
ncbi:hypothetical protein ACFY2D_10760 [Streptomyces nigra]|uniref:hypothetical protein n=1 Tax=Streptomyces nigra TaxID=1827580 RepID=UPI00342701CA